MEHVGSPHWTSIPEVEVDDLLAASCLGCLDLAEECLAGCLQKGSVYQGRVATMGASMVSMTILSDLGKVVSMRQVRVAES